MLSKLIRIVFVSYIIIPEDKIGQMIDVVFPRKGELTFVPKGYQQLDKFFV